MSHNTTQANLTSLIGRALLSGLFLFSGIGKLAAPAATKAYIASSGLPFPDLAYLAALFVEIGLALALLVGFKARIAAVLMAAFTVVTAVAFHTDFADQNQLINFLKNFAIAGGLLQVAALGAGGMSLDAIAQRRTGLVPN